MPTTGRTAAAAVVGAVVVLLSGCSSDTPVSLAGTGGSVGTTAEASSSASAAAGADATMQLADPTTPPSTKAAATVSPKASASKKATVKKASPAATATRRATVAASPSTAPRTSPKPTPKASPPTPAPSVSPTKPAGGGGGGGAGGTTSTVDEAAVVALTNAERAKNGCGPLSVNATLTTVARAHSKDMAVNGYFDHNSQDGRTPFDRMKNAGYTYSMAAENIAAGQQTPSSVVTAWMNSEGHRANILNCKLTQIGVGLYRLSGSPYGVYWTQDFGTPR